MFLAEVSAFTVEFVRHDHVCRLLKMS